MILLSIPVSPRQVLHAQGAKVSSPVELACLADQLRPGQWVLAPNVAPEGPILMYVALKTELRPGTTILVTQSSVGAQAVGPAATILDGVKPVL